MSERPVIYIIDTLNQVFRCFHGLPPLTNANGVPTGAVFGFTKWLQNFIDARQPKYLCAVYDAPVRNFRKELYPEYKAKRGPLDPTIKSQIKLSKAMVKALGVPTLVIPGVEADDTIATLAVQAQKDGFDVVIVSSDKDLMQLVNLGATIYDARYDKNIAKEDVEAKWGVPPHLISDLLSLAGDTSDNIPGVKGIGSGIAAKLLMEHGSLAGVRAAAGGIKGVRGDNLRKAIEDGTLDLWTTLARLKYDVALGCNPADLVYNGPNVGMRNFMFKELGFFSLLPLAPLSVDRNLPAR